MKLKFFFLLVIMSSFYTFKAQNLFTKEAGPAMNMDNSLATILMDLSTSNKDALMLGESAKSDTSKKYYPARLFGANQVYISRTIEQASLYEHLQDPSTLGVIYALFFSSANIENSIKVLQTNIEKSTVFNMFFKQNSENKDDDRIEYVQNKPFSLPANNMNPTDLKKYNKGLKENFEQYEIRMSIEKGSVLSMGVLYEYPQVRSWVQLKPIENLVFDLPDYLPTTHTKDTTKEVENCFQYVKEIKKQQAAYEK